jgi:hypothetical protein
MYMTVPGEHFRFYKFCIQLRCVLTCAVTHKFMFFLSQSRRLLVQILRGKAELDVERIATFAAVNAVVVVQRDRGDRLADVLKLGESCRALHAVLLREDNDLAHVQLLLVVLFKNIANAVLGDVQRGVEEVNGGSWFLYAILLRRLLVAEPVELASDKVLKARRLIRKSKGLALWLANKLRLVTRPNSQLLTEHFDAGDARGTRDRLRIVELDHGTPRLGLHKLDLVHITMQAQQVEHVLTVDALG